MSKNIIPADKPWVICRLGVQSNKRVIRRYVNRQDADSASVSDVGASDDLRIMTRFVKDGGQYVVAFDSAAYSPLGMKTASLACGTLRERASVVEVEE